VDCATAQGSYESTVSVAETHRFTWNSDGTPQNMMYSTDPDGRGFEDR
jgi:N-acylneuraminate cytidylyltransferase